VLRARLAQQGRAFVEQNFDIRCNTQRLAHLLTA
jgi:hypothetical protein